MPNFPNRTSAVLHWFFFLVGLGVIGCGVWNLAQSLRCQYWPTTEGVIQSAGMEMKRHSDSEGREHTTYSVKISYGYEVAGIHYTGKRLAFGTMSASARHADAILDRYPVGKTVPIHYAAGNPQQAVLETGIHGGTWICLGVGTAFALFGWMIRQLFAEKPAVPMGTEIFTSEREVNLQKPPVLMGVIFVLFGSFGFFMEPSEGMPAWMAAACGGLFVLVGLYLLACRLENKLYSKILMLAVGLTFLAIFHWVSFAPGERIGTVSGTFSQQSGVNVKHYFAAFTIVLDLVLLVCLVYRMMKIRKD